MCMVLFILPWNDVFFIWTINELYYTYIWGLSSHSRVFHSCGDVTIDCEGLRILTYTLHSTLIGEGSLVCHAYSDMGFVHSSLSRPRIESRSPECKANVLPTLYTCLSSLLNIYPVADGWTIRKWYNYFHVYLKESGNKFQSSFFIISYQ